MIRAAVERGITFCEAAEIYGLRVNEEIVGETRGTTVSRTIGYAEG
ncbi:hypothetical protein [Xanthomonas arboricola]|nr:hypothetical protein [Xanthomonas arboricola]MBB4596479.1 aryl-alcohol dehydrogenase-like predicted oxidoreductase [Xanthomonas arboricola]